MPDGGWTHDHSPFHRGEKEIQQRLGVRDLIEGVGRRVVRDYLPEQHRAFYAQLPFLVAGTVDYAGRPWASILAGRPGFAHAPDQRRMTIDTSPLYADPLGENLKIGSDIGLLGIELPTRRRNRLNGRVSAADGPGFEVSVRQSFGNCPQYIQSRAITMLPAIDNPGRVRPVHRSDRFDHDSRAMIGRADSFFIASAYSEDRRDSAQGVDVSHRGGNPGFVLVEDDTRLVFPDFAGNKHFNTLGNIALNPRVGLLFPDFHSGDLLYLTGRAEIIWDGPDRDAFEGAERLIRCDVESVIRVEGSLPLRGRFEAFSPVLRRTGNWQQVIAARRETHGPTV